MVYFIILMVVFAGCGRDAHPSAFVLEKSGLSVFKDLQQGYDLNMIRCFCEKRHVIGRVVTDYFHNGEVDVMTARDLLHTAVEKYLEKIANDIELKPFLKKVGIATNDLECTIFFKRGFKDKKAISSVSLLGGIVRYNQIDLADGVSKKILEEKYN